MVVDKAVVVRGSFVVVVDVAVVVSIGMHKCTFRMKAVYWSTAYFSLNLIVRAPSGLVLTLAGSNANELKMLQTPFW